MTALPEPLPREAPATGSEVESLLGSLERQRRIVIWKCTGLDAAGMTATTAVSSLTLGGLLKHLALVEDEWFGVRLLGRAPAEPWASVDWQARPDWEWRSAADDSLALCGDARPGWQDQEMPTSPWPIRVGTLLLRDARGDDIETLTVLRNDPVVNRYMLRNHVDPETFRRHWLAVPDSETDFSCVAELDGQVVAIGFLDIADGIGQPGMPERTEGVIGYIVDPAVSGQGVRTTLARGLLVAAFQGLGLRRVTASCNADNPASARVLEKAGMRREQHGIEDSWHADLGWVDGYQYALLDREWRALPRPWIGPD